jgi:hypothetical protein
MKILNLIAFNDEPTLSFQEQVPKGKTYQQLENLNHFFSLPMHSSQKRVRFASYLEHLKNDERKTYKITNEDLGY